MGASTIVTRSSRRRSRNISSTITSIVSKSLLVGSVLLSIVANNKLYNKKAQDLLSYAFRSNFLGSLHETLCAVASFLLKKIIPSVFKRQEPGYNKDIHNQILHKSATFSKVLFKLSSTLTLRGIAKNH